MSAVDVIKLSTSADALLKDRVFALIELTGDLRSRQGEAVHTHRSHSRCAGAPGRHAAAMVEW